MLRKGNGAGVLDMKKYFRRGLLTKGLLGLIIVMCAQTAAMAASQAVLSSVNIEGKDNSYKIVLKTSSDIELQSRVPARDRLILELENTKAAALIQTKFKNAKNIEDVIVQPISNNKTRLFISGPNVANSQVVIDSTKQIANNDSFAQTNNLYRHRQPEVQPEPQVEKTPQIEQQAQENQQTTAQEFIASNTTDNSTILDNIETAEQASNGEETTGIIASAPETEISSEEGSNPESDLTVQSEQPAVSADLFKPAADLELPESEKAIPEETTTTNKTPESAAAVTAKSMTESTQAKPSLFTTPWLMRFAIVFALVTFLVAYIRKEKLLSRRPKFKKSTQSKDSLDIYRSLNKERTQGFRTTGRTATTLDSRPANRARKAAIAPAPAKQANTSIKQYAAMQGYKNQATKQKNAINAGLSSKNATTKTALSQGGYRSTREKKPASNMDFLKSMAEHYERSGRHDLAMNIQKSIRKTTAKT